MGVLCLLLVVKNECVNVDFIREDVITLNITIVEYKLYNSINKP